jgi:hypothetical protein
VTEKRGKKKKRKKKKRKKKKGNTRIQGVLLLVPPQAMAEQDWTPFTITQGHLQNLTKHEFMTVAELTACSVLEEPAFPMPVEGYMVSFMSFYEREFSMPSHWFLYSLLQYYGLELHNLTPSGFLHITSFMTPCEAYLGIDPEFDLWNYFFCVRCPQDSDVELTVFEARLFMSSSGMEVTLTSTSPCIGR